jgi:hypothetical protein
MVDSIALALALGSFALSSPFVGSDATSTTRDWRANDEEESEEPMPPAMLRIVLETSSDADRSKILFLLLGNKAEGQHA